MLNRLHVEALSRRDCRNILVAQLLDYGGLAAVIEPENEYTRLWSSHVERSTSHISARSELFVGGAGDGWRPLDLTHISMMRTRDGRRLQGVWSFLWSLFNLKPCFSFCARAPSYLSLFLLEVPKQVEQTLRVVVCEHCMRQKALRTFQSAQSLWTLLRRRASTRHRGSSWGARDFGRRIRIEKPGIRSRSYTIFQKFTADTSRYDRGTLARKKTNTNTNTKHADATVCAL